MSMPVDLGAVDLLVDGIEADVFAAVRPAAQAAAQVYYSEVQINVARIGSVSGNLAAAVYQAYSERNSGPGVATYHVSWNPRKAPHGQLVEFGHVQRYATYLGDNGHWYTAKRPEAYGKPKPSRRASTAVKDAYYVLLPSPRQVAAQPFIRPALDKTEQAIQAAETELFRQLNGQGEGEAK